MLKGFIEQSEKDGNAGIQPHSALLKGDLLKEIAVSNHIVVGTVPSHQIPRRMELTLYSSMTLW